MDLPKQVHFILAIGKAEILHYEAIAGGQIAGDGGMIPAALFEHDLCQGCAKMGQVIVHKHQTDVGIVGVILQTAIHRGEHGVVKHLVARFVGDDHRHIVQRIVGLHSAGGQCEPVILLQTALQGARPFPSIPSRICSTATICP